MCCMGFIMTNRRWADWRITVNLPAQETVILRLFCKTFSRAQTDIVRELIRELEPKLKQYYGEEYKELYEKAVEDFRDNLKEKKK